MDRTRVGRWDWFRSTGVVALATAAIAVGALSAQTGAASGFEARLQRREAARRAALRSPNSQLAARSFDRDVRPAQNAEDYRSPAEELMDERLIPQPMTEDPSSPEPRMPDVEPTSPEPSLTPSTPTPRRAPTVHPPSMPLPSYEVSCPCGGDSCDDCVDCGSMCDPCIPCLRWTAGFEATFVQPRFDENVGLDVMQTPSTGLETLSEREFDYDFEFAPRVFVGAGFEDGVGLRAMWWQFDHDANPLREQPPANGQGLVSPPAFGDVDVSSNVATDVFTAATGMNAYTIDVEATKEGQFSAWRLGMAAGVRFASVDQSYLTELRNAGDVLRGRIEYRHRNQGFGPTLSLNSSLPLLPRVDLFAAGRGSLLFGEATSRTVAGEDLDLTTPLTTVRDTKRDDLLPTAELQLGLRWNGDRWAGQAWRPYASLAMESQYWNGVGNAVSETGNLGFFGLAACGGVVW